MEEIIQMGIEGKAFSLFAVADLVYGKVVEETFAINYKAKCQMKKIVWRTSNFSLINQHDRRKLVEAIVDAELSHMLQTRILCYLRKRLSFLHSKTNFTCVNNAVDNTRNMLLLPMEIIRWHKAGVPAVADERNLVKELYDKAKKEHKVAQIELYQRWLDAIKCD